jgi:DNA polymerase III alpha subunit
MDALAITITASCTAWWSSIKRVKNRVYGPYRHGGYVAPVHGGSRRPRDREYAPSYCCAKIKRYKNLMRLSSEAFLRGFYYKPRID